MGTFCFRGRRWLCGGAALAILLMAAVPAGAQKVKASRDALDDLTRVNTEMWLPPQLEDVNTLRAKASREEGQSLSSVFLEWDRFLSEQGGGWSMIVDRLAGRPALLWGKGIAWIPGTANSIRSEDLELPPLVKSKDVPLGKVAAIALAFIDAHYGLFGVESADLRLNSMASGPMLDYIYFLDFDWTYHGIPVERAHLVFRLNHGNLVQMGEEYISSSIQSLDPRPDLDAQTAWQILWGYLGGQTPEDEILEPGRLLVVPFSAAGSAENRAVMPGQGMGYRLVYALLFRRHGVLGTWEARVDAHSGEILSFLDRNDYGAVTGGVYQTSNLDTEAVRPLGFISVSNGTTKTCDAGGNYPYASGSATASLTGSYVKVVDSCGTSSLTTSTAPGDLAFGTSGGTDCTTPGVGGAGNTHAARTTYYHLTLWKEKAMAWLPSNTWLQGQLTDNVNLNQTCNAYWSGTSVNFFKSGGGCSNTGELPTVFLHEVGHGLDDNDGSPSSTVGSSESYADINALLMTHDSCIGVNFSPGVQCSGYGNPCTACTGIRDADYAKHTYSTSPAVPIQLIATTGYHCSRSRTYPGPCGYEGHCESYIMSEVGWDLAMRDLPASGYDVATAWFIADRLFFLSRPTSGDAYSCPTLATANGCGTSNWYETYLAVDDDNGNLSDGTPHAAAIYAAFNRHAVACSTGNPTSYSACPSIGQATVTAVPANASVALSWTSVTNAVSYEVYRNESSANAGYAKIASITAPATAYTDTAVQNGIAYFYRVLALGSTSACFGPISGSVSATPTPCTPPGVPTIAGVSAPADNVLRVSWTAGSLTGATYKVYRATGGCPGTSYVLLGSTADTFYDDAPVSGGATYAYKVSAVDSTAGCESALSDCAQGTATGTCSQPPTFAGLTSVAPVSGATCSLQLAWSAGTSNCGGTISYNLYRSAGSAPVPPAGLLQPGLTGTTYTDASVSSGTTYYYIVQALDSANGLNDGNTTAESGTPGMATTVTLYSNDFESTTGLSDWSAIVFSGSAADWRGIQQCTAHSGTQIFRYGGTTCTSNYSNGNDAGVIPNGANGGLNVPAGATSVHLSFWHRWNYNNYDGGSLWIALGTSNTYTYVPASAILAGSYNGTASGYGSWTGQQNAFIQTTVDLDSACNAITGHMGGAAGQIVKVAFDSYTDSWWKDYGWFLDDVNVSYQVSGTCTSCSAPSSLANNTAADLDACAASGVQVTWSQDPADWGDGGSGTRSYDLLVDGSAVQSGIAYPATSATYAPADGASHAYAVRYNNGCGLNATTAGASAADVNNPAIPTITGGSSNACPATSVPLSTEAAMSSYQWYLGGSPVAGASSATYTATQTGSYTVSYTNGSGCSGTSAPFAVTIVPCAAPEVSPPSDPAHHLVVVKNGSGVDLQFQEVASSNYNVYVSTSPNTHPFAVASSSTGKKDCAATTTSIAGGMLQVTGYAVESGITATASVYYILVTADNGPATEGPLGSDSQLVERTADGYCNR